MATEPEEAAPWRSLRIDVVDALTGRDLAATWNIDIGVEMFRMSSGLVPLTATMWARAEEEMRGARAKWEAGFLVSGTVLEHFVRMNADHDHHMLALHPPPGYVLLAPPAWIDVAIASGVQSVTAVVPLIREAVMDVHVIGPDGRAAEGARLVHLALGGVSWPHTVEHMSPGTLRVWGIPHLASERITAGVEWGIEGGEAAPPTVEIESEEPPSNLATSIPESLATPWTVELLLGGPTGSLSDHTESDFDMTFEELSLVEAEAGPQGSLRVRLLGRDGRQVTGEPLFGLTPDAKGEVVLERLRAGEHKLCLRTPGRLPARHETVIRADKEVVATLREPAGARIEVTVVDDDGRPRPTALLQIRGVTFFDVEGTTQRVDLFTDHLGRRSISRVEPGEAEIHASWGSRKGFERVALVDGETTRVRIVAK